MELPPHHTYQNGKVPCFITVKDPMMLPILSVPASAMGNLCPWSPLLYLFLLPDSFQHPVTSFRLYTEKNAAVSAPCLNSPIWNQPVILHNFPANFIPHLRALLFSLTLHGNYQCLFRYFSIYTLLWVKTRVPQSSMSLPGLRPSLLFLRSIHCKTESAPLRNAWTLSPIFYNETHVSCETASPSLLKVGWDSTYKCIWLG